MPACRYCLIALCVVLLTLGGGAVQGGSEAQARARVSGISFDARADGNGYVVRVHAEERIDAYSMPTLTDDASHLEWTLFNATLGKHFDHVSPAGPVIDYEATAADGHVTFRFALRADRSVRATAYRDRASNDLLLNLAYTDAPPTEPVATLPTPSAPEPSNVEADAEASSTEASSTEASSTEASSDRRARWRLNTVVIDPGHGGKDPGTHAHGLQEKDIVLDVAKILGGYLEDKLGVRVVYTRTDDRFVELKDRGHIANEAGGKLFISLHVNGSEVPSVRGTETFFLGPHKTEAARKVMERENKVVRLESNPEQYASFDEEALVRYALTQSAYMRQSERLAAFVEEQFDERVRRKSRGVKQAGFYVLWSASMPAVLVELGFLTNPQEARFLASENGKVYLASAIFRAIRDYKKEYEKGMNIARNDR